MLGRRFGHFDVRLIHLCRTFTTFLPCSHDIFVDFGPLLGDTYIAHPPCVEGVFDAVLSEDGVSLFTAASLSFLRRSILRGPSVQ